MQDLQHQEHQRHHQQQHQQLQHEEHLQQQEQQRQQHQAESGEMQGHFLNVLKEVRLREQGLMRILGERFDVKSFREYEHKVLCEAMLVKQGQDLKDLHDAVDAGAVDAAQTIQHQEHLQHHKQSHLTRFHLLLYYHKEGTQL